MAEFECMEPFDIDGGELAGLSHQQAFVLGYELATVHALLAREEPFTLPAVNWENKERIQRACIRRGRSCRFVVTQEGQWYSLAVE